tara:strand:+ start:81 stop:284 length:204 start_codon:yes stop_codon:yes gene_type:complete
LKVNKTLRPMRAFGNFLKQILNPPKTGNIWLCIKPTLKTKEEKDNFIFATIELLNNQIKIDEQDTKH